VIPASFCRVVRFDPELVDPQYAYYGLVDMHRSGRAAGYENQSTGISNFQFERFLDGELLRLPGRRTQGAIVEILGALDSKIALNENIAQQCDDIRALKLQSELRRGGVVAASGPLSSFANFVNGRAFTRGATGTGRMVVRIAELNSGPSGATVYNDLDVADQHLARPGDVLFAWSGSLTVARWFRPEAIINQHIFKVVPNGGVPGWLAYELVQSKLAEFKRIAADKATTMGHIQRRHLDELVIAPALEEIPRLDDMLRSLWDRALAAEQENLSLVQLRDILLPRLMSGELANKYAEKIVEDVT
jgi:type I restriction enzyme S subunit